MTQQFTEDVEIQGNLDVDGNVRVGDDPGTTNAMIEAQRNATSTSKPKRGLQTDGEIENENNPSGTITWSNHEVTVSGAFTDVTQVTALRASAQSSDGAVDSLVSIEANVNPVSGTVAEAVGLNIPDVTGATDNYAIKTGAGKIQIGELGGQGNRLVQIDNSGNMSTTPPVSYPTRAEVFADQFKMLTAGKSILTQHWSGRIYGFVGYQSGTAAINDEFAFPIVLATGTYKMYMLGERDQHMGIISWYVDNNYEGQNNWYNSSYQANYVPSSPISNITITTPGLHTVKGRVTGKSTNSTGYFFSLTKVWLELS